MKCLIADSPYNRYVANASVYWVVYTVAITPSLASAMPSYGPISGGNMITLRGANLAPTRELTCNFGGDVSTSATFVNTSAARCAAPANAVSAASTVEIAISLDGRNYSNGVGYSFVNAELPPTIVHVAPALVPLAHLTRGEVSVSISGGNFLPTPATCEFGPLGEFSNNSPKSPADVASVSEASCAVPPALGAFSGAIRINQAR